MSKPHNSEQPLHTIAINVRLAEEPVAAMSLRLLNAAANLGPVPNEPTYWPDGPPVVQLGSLEPQGGYLRRVEGGRVGEIPADDPGGSVSRVAPRADVFGIDAPVEPGKESETGAKIRSIIEEGRAIGARVVPYLACKAHQPTELQRALKNSLVLSRVLVFEVDNYRYDPVPNWMAIKNEKIPGLQHDYLDTRGTPLIDYLATSGGKMGPFEHYLQALIKGLRGSGFISSLLRPSTDH